MTNDNRNRRSIIVTAIGASLLVLALGLAHRVLVARLSTPLSKTPIDSAALQRFPMQIGDWTGEDLPLYESEAILDKINAEANINRRYSRDDGVESIWLFIAASGVTASTMVGHAPEVCNVLSGYSLVDQRFVELPIGNGTKLACRIVQFSRDALLDCKKKTVLYYYMADGQFYDNRLQFRYRVLRSSNMVNCVAQVQIAAQAEGTLTTDSTVRIVSNFAVDSASLIVDLFEHIQKDQSVDSPRALKEGSSR